MKDSKMGAVAELSAIVAIPASAVDETGIHAGLGKRVLDRMRASKARKPDVIDVRERPSRSEGPIVAPTDEQMRHADYVLAEVLDRTASGRSIKLGKAYQRQARFETIDGLGAAEIKALRFYRATYDRSAASETKSALDIRPRGGGGADAAIQRVADLAFANLEVKRIEDQIPIGVIATLRAVALHDQDFKAVAIARWGGRDVRTIVTTKTKSVIKTSLQCRSGRHREIVRDEFMAAASALVSIVAPMATPAKRPLSSPPIDVQPVQPLATLDPAFLDDRGRMLPSEEIADIIRQRVADEAA